MLRWMIAFGLAGTALAAAGAPADASPRRGSAMRVAQAPAPADGTARAQTSAQAADRATAQRAAERSALAKRYEDELGAIDRLKQQRPSWRRDRELRDNLTASLETSKQLAAATTALAAARQQQTAAARALLAAIDAELPTLPPGPRATQLASLRTAVAATVGGAPHKIVIPDSEIDPLADPEELDQQAAALRDSEAELGRQVAVLDVQATELHQIVVLRKQHDRAGELANREDDDAHRVALHSGQGGQSDSAGVGTGSGSLAPTSGPGQAGGPSNVGGPTVETTPRSPNSSYEVDAAVVLADVVDAPTIASLSRAQRSGDPAQRATAAEQTKAAVAARLAVIKQRRAAIEARAKALRSQH